MKSNIPFLVALAKEQQFICISEHWFNDYEKSVINNLITHYDWYVRCWDCNEKVTNFKSRRGNDCVAIMWPKMWSYQVKILGEGNGRIIGIEFKSSNEW